jgi:hypothetical protein
MNEAKCTWRLEGASALRFCTLQFLVNAGYFDPSRPLQFEKAAGRRCT